MPRLTRPLLAATALAATTLVGCTPSTVAVVTDPAPAVAESPELLTVIADVRRIAPALESFYRGGEYPRSLTEVERSLTDAGLELTGDNRLGAYRYDADQVEFTLCIEHPSGAFATYDTAPMATGDAGEEGGCAPL